LLLGFVAGRFHAKSAPFRLFVSTGLLGSFTTFSTFSVETIELLEADAFGSALLYVTLSLGLGLFSSWLGFWFGRRRFDRAVMREGGVR
ncbi:MAG: fluoride efflux transporter FluC, partial [Exiguobacterium mexicanum]